MRTVRPGPHKRPSRLEQLGLGVSPQSNGPVSALTCNSIQINMTPNFDVFRFSLYLNHLTAQLLMFALLCFGSPGKITANLNCSLARVSQSECIDLGRLHSVLKDTKYELRQDLLCPAKEIY